MNPKYHFTRQLPIAAGALTLCAAAVHAQINDSIRGAADEDNYFIATPDGWEHPMTEWGDPDIEATLDMMQASGIPLQRCANSIGPGRGGQPPAPCDTYEPWVSEEAYQANVERVENRVDRSVQLLEEGDLAGSMRAGLTDPNIAQRMTSLIVEPADGQVPELTQWAKEAAHRMGSDWPLPGEDIDFQTQYDFDSWDRCSTRGLPSMMMPYRYNGGFKIHQSPGFVAFNIEMIHETRIIPVGDVPPLDEGIGQMLGESRGHWEGNTLVIETTNFKGALEDNIPLMNLAVAGSPPGNRFPASEEMKITERVTRLNDDWWLYEIKTEDPKVLTEPFTVRYPMHHDPEYWWPEYACWEDNYIVPMYIGGNRERLANPTPEPPQEPVQVGEEAAALLDGTWVGWPDIGTIEYSIELEFTDNGDGTVNGRLVGTTLPDNAVIDRPLRNLRINGQSINFTFPNVDGWSFSGTINPMGDIEGSSRSAQGAVVLNFEKS